jgi:hypothetical protein
MSDCSSAVGINAHFLSIAFVSCNGGINCAVVFLEIAIAQTKVNSSCGLLLYL